MFLDAGVTLMMPGGGFGRSIASADVNADGFADVVVGAPGMTAAFVFAGSMTGVAAAPTFTLRTAGVTGFGESLGSAGDTDRDGASEPRRGRDRRRVAGVRGRGDGARRGAHADDARAGDRRRRGDLRAVTHRSSLLCLAPVALVACRREAPRPSRSTSPPRSGPPRAIGSTRPRLRTFAPEPFAPLLLRRERRPRHPDRPRRPRLPLRQRRHRARRAPRPRHPPRGSLHARGQRNRPRAAPDRPRRPALGQPRDPPRRRAPRPRRVPVRPRGGLRRAALTALGALGALRPKIVRGGTFARCSTSSPRRAEAAVVYATDARGRSDVTVVGPPRERARRGALPPRVDRRRPRRRGGPRAGPVALRPRRSARLPRARVHRAVIASLLLSLRVTLAALAVVIPAGVALGWWLARRGAAGGARWWTRWWCSRWCCRRRCWGTTSSWCSDGTGPSGACWRRCSGCGWCSPRRGRRWRRAWWRFRSWPRARRRPSRASSASWRRWPASTGCRRGGCSAR